MAAKEPLCSAVSMIRALRTPRVRIDTTDRNGSEEAVMVYHANDVQILAGPLALPWKCWRLWRNVGGHHVGAIRGLTAAPFALLLGLTSKETAPKSCPITSVVPHSINKTEARVKGTLAV